jgi:hypothetical protein
MRQTCCSQPADSRSRSAHVKAVANTPVWGCTRARQCLNDTRSLQQGSKYAHVKAVANTPVTPAWGCTRARQCLNEHASHSRSKNAHVKTVANTPVWGCTRACQCLNDTRSIHVQSCTDVRRYVHRVMRTCTHPNNRLCN